MSDDMPFEIHRMRRLITEYEIRLQSSKYWTDGEMDMVKRKLRIARQTLEELKNKDRSVYP